MAVDDGVPLFVAHLLDDVVPGIARVVDDDVDAAERLQCGLDQAFTEVRLGDIAGEGQCLAAAAADLLHHIIGRCGVKIVDNHAGTFARELQGDAAADTTPCTSDDGNLAFQFPAHVHAPAGCFPLWDFKISSGGDTKPPHP